MTTTVLLSILFIDVGPTKSAWAIVEVRSNGTIVPVQGGWHSLRDLTWLGGLMDSVWKRQGVCCLEYIDGALYDRKRWQDLGETMRIEGEIRAAARMVGAPHAMLSFPEMRVHRKDEPRTLFCVPASSWRKQLCGRGNASDAEIAHYVTHLTGREVVLNGGEKTRIVDLPAARDKDAREHLYDAIGGALAMVEVFMGVKLKVPDVVRAEAEKARAKKGQRNAIERTLGKFGIDPSRARMAYGSPIKRKPSRGVRAARRAKAMTSKYRGAKK